MAFVGGRIEWLWLKGRGNLALTGCRIIENLNVSGQTIVNWRWFMMFIRNLFLPIILEIDICTVKWKWIGANISIGFQGKIFIRSSTFDFFAKGIDNSGRNFSCASRPLNRSIQFSWFWAWFWSLYVVRSFSSLWSILSVFHDCWLVNDSLAQPEASCSEIWERLHDMLEIWWSGSCRECCAGRANCWGGLFWCCVWSSAAVSFAICACMSLTRANICVSFSFLCLSRPESLLVLLSSYRILAFAARAMHFSFAENSSTDFGLSLSRNLTFNFN